MIGGRVLTVIGATFAGLTGLALLGLAALDAAQRPGTELANPGFEEPGSPPAGWTLDAEAATKGEITRVAVPGASGTALALAPNALNRGGDKPLGLGQILDVTTLRGHALALQARLAGTGGAVAVVGLAFLDQGGAVVGVPISLRGATPPPLTQETLPLDEVVPAAARSAIVFAVAEGQSGIAYVDDVALVEGPKPVPSTPSNLRARVSIEVGQDLGPVRRALFGANVEWIRNAQGLWNGATGSLDGQMLDLARMAGVSVLRFPGGGWSDSYDWRKGVGPRDSRPAAIHAPGERETSANVLGTDEIIEAARSIGADLLLTLNLGDGSPDLAAGWARYVQARTAGGRPRVTWELGNELYMESDISGGQTDPATYVSRAKATIAAVRAVDPQARFYAIGLENFGRYRFNAYAGWNAEILSHLAAQIDGLAIHNAYAPLLTGPDGGAPGPVYRAMLAAPANIAVNLATTVQQLEAVEGGRRLVLAITEWGPLFAVDPKNRYFDHVKTLGSGVFAARVLNAFLLSPRVAEAEFFKLSDLLNAGWIGRRPGGGYAATPALKVMGLYARHLRGRLVAVRTETPSFSGGGLGFTDRVPDAPTVEAVAARREDGNLAVLISNASLDASAEVEVSLDRERSGMSETISGPAPDAGSGTGMISVPGLHFAETANFGIPRPAGRDEIAVTTVSIPAARSVRLTLPPTSVAALILKATE